MDDKFALKHKISGRYLVFSRHIVDEDDILHCATVESLELASTFSIKEKNMLERVLSKHFPKDEWDRVII